MAQRKAKKSVGKDEAPESPFDFEKGLDELEQLVERMEQGEMSLEESLSAFERGVELTRRCQKALEDAEQKVQVLVEQAGGDAVLEDLDPDDEPDED